jgi:uncharacterized membrane protein YjgN (DUF898 family)
MSKESILVVIGMLLLIIGFIVAYFAGRELIYNITVTNYFSHVYSYLIEATIAIALMVVGGLMVIFGLKKS